MSSDGDARGPAVLPPGARGSPDDAADTWSCAMGGRRNPPGHDFVGVEWGGDQIVQLAEWSSSFYGAFSVTRFIPSSMAGGVTVWTQNIGGAWKMLQPKKSAGVDSPEKK